MRRTASRRGWFRSREQSVGLAVGFLCGGAMMIAEAVGGRSTSPLVNWLAAGGFVVSGARLALMGARPHGSGVTIRNLLRTVEIPWTQIRSFRVGWYGPLPRVGLTDLLDGRTIPILGISGPPPVTRPANRTAETLVAELNERLRDAREGIEPTRE